MKNILSFDEFVNEHFINEANLSKNVLEFKKGDCLIVTKDFKVEDLDFSKSAVSWWGENIYSIKNERKTDFWKNANYSKNDLLAVYTDSGKINNTGLGEITGYFSTWGLSQPELRLADIKTTEDYHDMKTQIQILALLNGFAKIVPYKSLSKTITQNFEANLKIFRVQGIINGHQKQITLEVPELRSLLVLNKFELNLK